MATERKKKFKTKVKSSQAISDEINNSMDELLVLSVKNTTNGELKLNIKKVNGKITKKDVTITGEFSDEQKNIAKTIKDQVLKTLNGITEGYFKVVFKSEIETL